LSKDINSLGKRSWFWKYLAIFWPEDKIREWKLEIFPDDDDTKHGVDSIINLVTLKRDIHAAWNEGMIAIKPIELSPDKKTMKLRFFIQKRSKADFSSITTEPESSRSRKKHSGGFKLHVPRKIKVGGELSTEDDDADEWENLKSGDFIEWTTNDPEKLPLPSFKLLEMQWFLNRVIGMAGAGEQDDDDFYDDDLEDLADDVEDEEVEENVVTPAAPFRAPRGPSKQGPDGVRVEDYGGEGRYGRWYGVCKGHRAIRADSDSVDQKP
jgi:hypothetical protein